MRFWTRWIVSLPEVIFNTYIAYSKNVNIIMTRFLYLSTLLLLIVGLSACQQDPSHAAGEDHEHGPDTHTHAEPMAADTAGTYVDSTAAFFDEDEHAADGDHEHGPDTHTHDDDAPAHQ